MLLPIEPRMRRRENHHEKNRSIVNDTKLPAIFWCYGFLVKLPPLNYPWIHTWVTSQMFTYSGQLAIRVRKIQVAPAAWSGHIWAKVISHSRSCRSMWFDVVCVFDFGFIMSLPSMIANWHQLTYSTFQWGWNNQPDHCALFSPVIPRSSRKNVSYPEGPCPRSS